MKRKVCIITGTRAEYGVAKPLFEAINRDKNLELQIIATGMHLVDEFGFTFKEIENDGFKIDQKVDIDLSSDSDLGVCHSISLAIDGLAKAYLKLKPEILILVGDRYEMFAGASAALILRIPVAHISGGETTEGSFDESLRHSITKMSHLHFCATDQYRKRVIQLGEVPKRVFNVGAIGLDSIAKLKFLSKSALEKRLRIKFNRRNLIILFHPVTLEHHTAETQVETLIKALDELKNTNLIFIKSNSDTGARAVSQRIERYAAANRHKTAFFVSIKHLDFLSLMRLSDAIVGNSSSGIIEAPSFKIGTVNIGDRQKGRIRVASIIDCEPTQSSIRQAIGKLYSPAFSKGLKKIISPYGDGHASDKIVRIIKKAKLKNIIKKSFFDL